MNERIKELRKALNLTAEKFSEKIGVTRSAVSNIERGHRNVTEQSIMLMVNEFNVNEVWLRTGKGDMFVETKEDYIADLSKRYNLDELDIKIVESYLSLDEESRQVIKDYIHQVASSMEMSEEEKIKAEIDEEVESYRRELELEKRAAEKSSALDTTSDETAIKINKAK